MSGTRTMRVAAILGTMTILIVLPLTAFAAQKHRTKTACATTKHGKVHTLAVSGSSPVVQFGQYGGNIRPWDASIDAQGNVTSKGITASETRLADLTNALNGLLKLADAEGFWSMPTMTSCPGTNPDVASRYIQITSSSGTRKVAVHGGCLDAFNQLFAVLLATGNVHY